MPSWTGECAIKQVHGGGGGGGGGSGGALVLNHSLEILQKLHENDSSQYYRLGFI
jgi:hypothetical protein